MLTTRDVAGRLGVTLRRLQQWIENGTLPAEKIGRDYLIRDGVYRKQEATLKALAERGRGRPRKS